MTPKEFYENLEKKKPFTELTSTGISDNLTNVFEFAKMYAEAITVTRCCEELKGKKAISFEVYQDTFYGKLYNGKYQSKLDKNKIVTHNDIVKEYESEQSL
jgi:hypothetical protein